MNLQKLSRNRSFHRASRFFGWSPNDFIPPPVPGEIQFWFDLGHPWTFLAAHRIAATARLHGASSVWIPINPTQKNGVPRRQGVNIATIEGFAAQWELPEPCRCNWLSDSGRLTHIAHAAFERHVGIDFCLAVLASLHAGESGVLDDAWLLGILGQIVKRSEAREIVELAAGTRVKARVRRVNVLAERFGLTGQPVIRTHQDILWTAEQTDQALAESVNHGPGPAIP
ncbi:hypothetical protein [Hyphobacterium sp.]|uniref:hypothetical protein n=1 Tax=Hyphobacterium sp. TaxID=2004662 RepID=UPI003747BB96